jgi:hypothetical protein
MPEAASIFERKVYTTEAADFLTVRATPYRNNSNTLRWQDSTILSDILSADILYRQSECGRRTRLRTSRMKLPVLVDSRTKHVITIM